MAIGSNNNREIQFKKRGNNNKLKVLIYGRDGSGKSTYAEKYCQEHELNAVVIDVEDTNYTDMIMVNDIDLSDDVKAFRNLKRILSSIPSEFDTIVIDGIDEESVRAAMKAGIEAACNVPGVLEIDAGNFGGNLGAYKINLQDLF